MAARSRRPTNAAASEHSTTIRIAAIAVRAPVDPGSNGRRRPSPAAVGGIRPGDLMLKIDGRPVAR